ncbi:MAG: SRPBCC family protein [Chloroflexota bacterium]
MRINEDAPIVLRHEIDIFAPPEKIWQHLSQIEVWREWHPDIHDAHWVPSDNGSQMDFQWRVGMFKVKSRIESWIETEEIGWSGSSWLAHGRQVFYIDGNYKSSRVWSEASIEGFLVVALRGKAELLLNRFGGTWLGALKTKLEAEGPSRRKEEPRPPRPRRSMYVPRFPGTRW